MAGRRTRLSLLLGGAAAVGMWAQGAVAQDVPQDRASPATASADAPGEIIVTAQRRAERLQDVPIQVTAFNSQALEDAGIRSTADVVAQVPNISFDRGNTYRSTFITMRGLTQITNADPPVAFVLDGVPQTNQNQLSANLFDLERVEILRGPQGALYGRNAVGGAINVVTAAPRNTFEFRGNAAYGNADTLDISSAVSGALVDDMLLVRASGTYRRSDGLVRNSFRGDRSDFVDHDYSLRGRVLINPARNLRFDLRAEYSDFEGGSNGYSAVFSGDPNDFVDPQFNLQGSARGNNTDLVGKIDYDFGVATLTSISAYARFRQVNRADLDFRNPVDSPGGFNGLGIQVGQGQDFGLDTFSQEVRLVSSGNTPLRWLVGGYYLHTDRDLRTRGFIDLNSDPRQIDNPALVIIDRQESNDDDAYAAFAQVDYDITDTFMLTGGLRYDRDDRNQTDLATDAVRRASFDHLQPKVTVTWKPTDDRLFYATYSTGFRSGGFNAPNVTVSGFDAETLENFEIGFKTRWFDRRLTLNGSAFRMNVDNYQFFLVDAATASQIIDTIDRVRIQGLELEAIANLAGGLEGGLAIGVTDTEIRRSLFPADVGNRTPRTVPFSLNASLQYRHDLGRDIAGFARVELQHLGRKYWGADNTAVQDAYNIVNLRAGVERGAVSLYGYARNLFGADYYTEFVQPRYSGLDIAIGYPGTPASYGVELRLRF